MIDLRNTLNGKAWSSTVARFDEETVHNFENAFVSSLIVTPPEANGILISMQNHTATGWTFFPSVWIWRDWLDNPLNVSAEGRWGNGSPLLFFSAAGLFTLSLYVGTAPGLVPHTHWEQPIPHRFIVGAVASGGGSAVIDFHVQFLKV